MILAAVILSVAALAVLFWHMQKPRPPRIAVSFARFIPALPPAPSGWSRITLTVPRDLPALACLMLAAGMCLWALMDARRSYLAARADHLGLRVVLDRSHSMSVRDGSVTRVELALARLEEARAVVQSSGAQSVCMEMIGVAGTIMAPRPLPLGGGIPDDLVGVSLEGGDPALLTGAAMRPESDCALTHVLVLTDQPQSGHPQSDRPAGTDQAAGHRVLWDQIGAPSGNNGLRAISLLPAAFGQERPEIRIEGVSSGAEPPSVLRLETPGGMQELTVEPDPDSEGRWFASAAWSGTGSYRARLTTGDGYGGDDLVEAQFDRQPGLRAEWRLDSLSRPALIAAGAGDTPLITTAAALTPEDMARPLLITWPGFGGAGAAKQLGPFREDMVLFSALNFDALEAGLPAPWPGLLPEGFSPVLTDASGGVLVARRLAPFGLLLPEPRPDLPELGRSLSLTLFFAGLADLMTLPPEPQDLRWFTSDDREIPDAWKESLTGRALAPPVDLTALGMTASATEEQPLWPWFVLAALVLILAERVLRLLSRAERVA